MRNDVTPIYLWQDLTDHWLNWNAKKSKYKLTNYNESNYVSCTKCIVFLSLKNKSKLKNPLEIS